ncbi:MAG: MgtC/SapB family protein [Acidiferrobacterales bacterium]
MHAIYIDSLTKLVLALLAGGLIGLERSYNGRPAGFRTHTLVCMSSSLLMLLTVHQIQLLPEIPLDTVRIDPTRMAQGIMTGIGFLGAGVIMKEKLSIRGLTTAASIWITAAIGILLGIGFYSAAGIAALLTVGTLSTFRYIEAALPSIHYGRLQVRMPSKKALSEDTLRSLIKENNFNSGNPTYTLLKNGSVIEYEMTVWTRDKRNYRILAETLTKESGIEEFHLTPTSD